ncbi:hypothetical protein OSL09_22875, partial [Escherichia coli]|nr:hypothetical protein [Escherichia coli]
IGAPTGVACSVCPGGVTSGHPVNPLLGAKVLPGETDIALPAPLPFIQTIYQPGSFTPLIRVETATGELAK